MHLLGPCAYEELFSHDLKGACQNAKTGFLNSSLEYLNNEPLTQLIAEFSAACDTNYRKKRREPSDPLTHAKVLDIFDRALVRESEWPTSGDQAIPFTMPVIDEQPTQRGSRVESDIAGSRYSLGHGMPQRRTC